MPHWREMIDANDYMDVDFINKYFQLLVNNIHEFNEYYCSFHNDLLRKDLRKFLGVKRLMKKDNTTQLLQNYIQHNIHDYDIKVDDTYYATHLINARRIGEESWLRLSEDSNSIEIVIRYKDTRRIAYKLILGKCGTSLKKIINEIHFKKRLKLIRHRKIMRKQIGFKGM